MAGDGECTFFPDKLFGVELTPACITHDNSPLGLMDHWQLMLDVAALFGGHPVGQAIGFVMFAGTTAWWLMKRLIGRNQSANSTNYRRPAMRSLREIIVHCSATPEGREVSVATIRDWHKQRGWRDIGYHFVVYLDGTAHKGRPVEQIGAHVAGRNTGTIGICYVGGVDKNMRPKDTRTPAQKVALEGLLKELVAKYGITKISGHRDYSPKACPSFDATAEYAPLVGGSASVTATSSSKRTAWLQRLLKRANYDPGKDDGLIGPQTTKAIRAYQTDMGLKVNGKFDTATVALLKGIAAERKAEEHEAIVADAAATDRVSTTKIATGLATVAGVSGAAKEAADNVGSLAAAAPWGLAVLVILGAGWWIWQERRRKQAEAKVAL
jgi:N-acetylmuramoyl-L-alanine amidase